jgi:tetratricopeptide (TPR) repeat protein
MDDAAVLAWLERNPRSDRNHTLDHLDTCGSCLELVAELARTRDDHALRYILDDEIARGGMGRVIAATDRVLGRRVALKTVKTPLAELERRFAREMRITARLQHPGIVPIYDAGVLPSGEPFYAMRMMAGRTLDRAIAGATSLRERLALVPAVTAVANAIAYAHGHRVIHRDLKPQNVVLEPFGETVVIDWGVAKDLDSPDPEGSGPTVIDQLTIDGEIVGTLGYMAPEQLDGDPVDERADVYGLGGILYHVLTGVPPHKAAAGALRVEDIVAIEEHEPEVPAELAAIAKRALAADPAERYSSARELAADLERFQAGALVGAHRYSLRQLAWRWLSRHRAVVGVTAAAIAVLFALSLVGVERIVAERAIAEDARADAEQQRDAAEAVIDYMLHDLGKRLDALGKIELLSGVGGEIDTYYLRRAPRDRGDLVRRSSALGVLGDARLAGGDVGAALAAYRRSVEAALLAGEPDAQCRARQRAGEALLVRGDRAGAELELRVCEQIARDHLATAPRDASWNHHLAASLAELGAIARQRGYFDRARAMSEDAVRAAKLDTTPEGTRLWVKVMDDAGMLAFDRGDTVGAAAVYRDALARIRAAVEANPVDTDLRAMLVAITIQSGRVEQRRNDIDAAERQFGAARDLAQALVDRDPANKQWLHSLSSAQDYLGMLALEREHLDDALRYAKDSLATAERLAKLDPHNAQWARDVGTGQLRIAHVEHDMGHEDRARDAALVGVAMVEELAKSQPDNAEATRDLSVSLLLLGDIEIARKDLAAARTVLERSATLRRGQLVKQDAPRTRRELASILLVMSDLPMPAADHGRIIDELRELIAPLRALTKTDDDMRETVHEVDVELAKLK